MLEYRKGTQVDVVLNHGTGRANKTPRRTGVSAVRIYNDQREMARSLAEFYAQHFPYLPDPVVPVDLEGNSLDQYLVVGRTLSRIRDKELRHLPSKTHQQLEALLTAAQEIDPENPLDVFGYDYDHHLLTRVYMALDPRYSTNIIIDEQKEVKLIDADRVISPTRDPLITAGVRVLLPVMRRNLARFKAEVSGYIS